MFLASKRLVNADGSLGSANALERAASNKAGIHGSPTCTMIYDGAHREYVGCRQSRSFKHVHDDEPARLQVGVQGVAIAERAFQQAFSYALDRRQGRSAWTGEYPARLFNHPDVRRMLMLMKAKIEAARAICLATAVAADLAEGGRDNAARERAQYGQVLRVSVVREIFSACAWASSGCTSKPNTEMQPPPRFQS